MDMSESVVADFVATFDATRLKRPEPVTGRVLLSEKRLVLAAGDDDKLTIPLSSIVDVAVGHVPTELSGFFESKVTVAFKDGGKQNVAAVEADGDMIEKFSTVLFKVLLNGTEITIKHPARVGGRVTEAEFVPANLALKPQQVVFATSAQRVNISLSMVTGFGRTMRTVLGTDRPVLQIRHMSASKSMLTVVGTESPRRMSILGRYLRLEYSELLDQIEDIEITDNEKKVLVAIYSGAGGADGTLSRIVGEEPSKLTLILNRLREDDLVVDTETGAKLTPIGQVAVNHHLEDVNV
jgi:helix-turn-helix protein